jgi:3-dehydrotetronate 4-kinase
LRELLFAAIADDFTGGSDLAGMLFAEGVRTVQTFGVPGAEQVALMARYDAVVVSLKSRSIEASAAVGESLAAHRALKPLNPRQWQFKYCSTFDSTPQGNIGPVAAALMEASGVKFTIAVPALPVNGRTQYNGHLFVLGELLSESPMRSHPLNPMTDSNLVRWLQLQTQKRTGLIPWSVVSQSEAAIVAKARELEESGVAIALVDAITDDDLSRIAEAFAAHPLITGGSGLAMQLPRYWTGERAPILTHAPAKGPAVILSGSCSSATLVQLDHLRSTGAAVMPYTTPPAEADAVLAHGGLVALASSAPPDRRTPGAERDIEQRMGEWARHFVNNCGVRRIVVAGGETSGAVVEALGIRAVELTSILDPGVPALRTIGGAPLSLALKSGNFGSRDFFTKALSHI